VSSAVAAKAATEAVRDDGDAAIVLLAGSPGVVLASDQPALDISRESIGPIDPLLEYGHALPRQGAVMEPLT
jgi:hypothetical protein